MRKLLIVLFLITSLNSYAVILGQREGGGGNLVAAEFAAIGRIAIEFLGMADDSIDVKSIFEAIKLTKVTSVPKICFLDLNTGAETCLDAFYNSSGNEIQFDYKKWNTINCRSKMTLATHEYLRVVGLESGDYTISGRFLSNKFIPYGSRDDYDQANSNYSREVDRICREYSR